MAKSKPENRRRNKNSKKSKPNGSAQKPKTSPESLLEQSVGLLQVGEPEQALTQARRALALLQPAGSALSQASLPALSLLGEIHIELGDSDSARDSFQLAASLDPDGTVPESAGGGVEKFFWLAQLCEEGGQESVQWFRKGAEVLRRDIAELEGKRQTPEIQQSAGEKKAKLANALCGIVEVYMTDLSWEEDAESVCESLITEAMLVAPDNPEALQTLASIRISQGKRDDAKAALTISLGLWKDLEPEDARVPDFPTRISLARLLMEAGMEDEAIVVLDRLVTEDDSSIEAWYLGGWCLHLMGDQKANFPDTANQQTKDRDSPLTLMKASRDWLQNSLNLYQMLEYEDERLKEHALELVEGLNKLLGPPKGEGEEDADDAEDGDADEWEDEEDSDQEMEVT